MMFEIYFIPGCNYYCRLTSSHREIAIMGWSTILQLTLFSVFSRHIHQ